MPDAFEYNISAHIAELIQSFKEQYDYLQITFISKKKKHTCQDTFFVGKDGKILNGKKETK